MITNQNNNDQASVKEDYIKQDHIPKISKKMVIRLGDECVVTPKVRKYVAKWFKDKTLKKF